MKRSFRQIKAALRSFTLLSTPGAAKKMVRFFTNPYDDFKLDTNLVIDKDAIINQIHEHTTNICKRLQPSHKNIDGGLYVGVTGVSFMFLYLSKNALLSEKKAMYLQKSMEYLEPAMTASAGDKTSFLLGDAGTYALATVVRKELGLDYTDTLKMYKSLCHHYLHSKFLKCGGDEFFVGRAGYLAGALWMSREIKAPVLSNEEMYKICDIIVDSGRNYSLKHKSPCPLMYHYYNTEYLGAAHGISFILQMLLSVAGYLKHNKTAAQDILASVEFIASLQVEEGNWPCCMVEVGLNDHKLVHWCHGAPGIIYLMAKAYLIFKDKRYRDACIKAGDFIWRKGLLRKGPGICHGIAGNAYAFLLLYRLIGDPKYLHRAKMFSEFLLSDEFIRDARFPDNPESLYEGTAGTTCFLSDLLVPEKAEFPFQDVFSVY